MKKILCSLLVGIMFISSLSVSAASFTDVKQGDWYYETVTEMTEKGLFNGKGNNLFCPNDTMTKANGATYRVEKNGNIIAEINSKLYFTVIPAEGYEIGTVTANGAVVSKINDSTYMVDNLQEQVILSAIFFISSYT